MTPIQNSTTVAGVKPLETTCSSGTLTSTLTFSCSFYYHFCQFWLWLRDYIHCTASNFATRPWKLATWLSKVFSTNLVPVALRCPILWLSISWLQVICDPNGTCWTPAYNFNYMSVVFCYCYCLYIYMIDRLQHRKLLPKGVIQDVPKARLRLRIFHRTFTAKAYALC